MILLRIEHDDTPDVVCERFQEVLSDLGLNLELVDEGDGWLEYGLRRDPDFSDD